MGGPARWCGPRHGTGRNKKSLQTGVQYKAVYRVACDDFSEEGKLQRSTLNRKLILGSIECVDDY